MTTPPANPAASGPVDLRALADMDRLRAVADYNLFDPALRDVLNQICAETAADLHQPIGLVTIVLDSAQLVIGKSGLQGWIADVGGTPAEWAFCARAVLADDIYVVDDAALDPVQATNPLVVNDGVRAYAGVPLRSPSGHTLGRSLRPQRRTPTLQRRRHRPPRTRRRENHDRAAKHTRLGLHHEARAL